MRSIRTLHLALSCFMAPILIVFLIAGADLLLDFGSLFSMSDSFENLFYNLRKIHEDARLSSNITPYNSNDPFTLFAALLAFGMTASTIMGLIVGLKSPKFRNLSLLAVGLGIVIPLFILFLQ